jgi:hypothetical protein
LKARLSQKPTAPTSITCSRNIGRDRCPEIMLV